MHTQDTYQRIAGLNARIDRLPGTGLRPAVFLVVGLSYFFAFYEISTFAYTLPTLTDVFSLPAHQTAYPVSANLAGYAVGAYLLGTVADLRGRRMAMMLTVTVITVSATLTALSWDIWSLTTFRFLSGVGTGAEIVLAAALISEFSPAMSRGKYVMLNYLWGAAGLACTPFVAIALLEISGIGWRLVYGIGALAALIILFMRGRFLPESPRWLVLNGRGDQAEQLVRSMEERCRARVGELPSVPDVRPERVREGSVLGELFRPPYLRRTALMLGFWFLMYVTNYSYLGYFPAILIDAGLPEPRGLLYSAIGQLGLPVGAVIALIVADRFERKYYIGIVTLIAAVGYATVALSAGAAQIMLGAAIVSVAFAAGSVAYVYTTEIFPTRVRSTGAAICNGVGHVGGIIGPFITVAVLGSVGGRATLWVLGGFVTAAAILLLVGGIRTSKRELTELST